MRPFNETGVGEFLAESRKGLKKNVLKLAAGLTCAGVIISDLVSIKVNGSSAAETLIVAGAGLQIVESGLLTYLGVKSYLKARKLESSYNLDNQFYDIVQNFQNTGQEPDLKN